MKKKFIRTDSWRFSKIGRGRKKLQKWRCAKGRHNKIRKKRKSYPVAPSIGYGKDKKYLGRIEGEIPVRVMNLKDMSGVDKNGIVVIGKIGARKKMEIIKKADEMKIKVLNLNRGVKNETK